MHIAGISLVPDRANSHLGFVHIVFSETRGIHHGLRGTLRFGLGESSAMRTEEKRNNVGEVVISTMAFFEMNSSFLEFEN
jgi:hypothetical protein